MSHSEVHLVNVAMIRLGQPAITSLTDDTRQARVANQMYETTRDEVLALYPWNSATKRVSLPKLAAAPTWGFTAAFQLPADFLRLHKVEDPGIAYRPEGRTILANADTFKIVYIAKITDPMQMDELLKAAISAKLAMDMAIPLTGSDDRLNAMAQWYKDTLAEARFADAIQAPAVDTISGSTWLDGRAGAEPALGEAWEP